MSKRVSFTAIVVALIVASAVLEIGIIDGSQAQVLQKTAPTNSIISPQEKSKLCDPNNPKLGFVNTTESHICGIPKSVKNVTAAATPTSSTTSMPPQPSSPKPVTPPSSEPSPPTEDIPGLP
jgi:hypothetical protein